MSIRLTSVNSDTSWKKCTVASAPLGLNRGALSGWRRQTGCNLAQHFKVDGSLHHLHLIPHSTTLDDYYYYLSLDKQNDMESNSPRIHHVISTGTRSVWVRGYQVSDLK